MRFPEIDQNIAVQGTRYGKIAPTWYKRTSA